MAAKLYFVFRRQLLFNTGANLVVAARYKKDFPELHEVKVTLRDFKDLGIFHDLKYYLVHRLSNTIYARPIPSSPAVWRAAL